ncbi:MAG: hypothetical protein COT91_00065 [Candidatus Doudnabacteria bacterium CG10_big_fil_rev_8_21_14_0_10_41_10]|uniref:Uncharacterized protein n=1 Tax=Candidatus Doudnabacteria bacterium CG10_big_fil_rev_8_21_14_0_10_41_10 TaxID=1974551 RepID=A0A2H0VEZ5_9BACT|nr:MAG: hypothetical protein COT91_00065 [Candidatus Doudnabacteria bacterium CG10_big_fil_rev_8_21_14_0_10_41_10]
MPEERWHFIDCVDLDTGTEIVSGPYPAKDCPICRVTGGSSKIFPQRSRGSTRPMFVTEKQFEENWNLVFSKSATIH